MLGGYFRRSFFHQSFVDMAATSLMQNFCGFRHFAAGALKTNKSVAKRFKKNGNGDLIRRKAGKSHNTGYKSRGRVNRLAASAPIKDKKVEKKMQRLLNF